jgi:hypothetical protein
MNNQLKTDFLNKQSREYFLPDHRLTDASDFASTAPVVSPLSARGGFFISG